jgi:L-threonylcarbamoyladenylate synthase
MEILDRKAFEARLDEMLGEIKAGKLFIYPTDTIYGIGCDATNRAAVERIRALKKRDKKPFSVIAPSVRWIMLNCSVGQLEHKWIRRLPGPYTLVLRLSNGSAVSGAVNENLATIGIRIPAKWFSGVVAHSDVPFVTTSVNVAGEPHMTSLSDLNPEIRDGVDYVIDSGELKNKPSKVIDLDSGDPLRD